VIPFLLRGVSLLGIDFVTVPYQWRVRAWARVVSDLPMAKLEAMVRPAGWRTCRSWGRRS
jgi:acrylyl-CoA reductase (NADPH)